MLTSAERPARSGGNRQSAAAAERRRAKLVAIVAGLTLPVWFWLTLAVWDLPPSPPAGVDPEEFVQFYVDNYSRFPTHATAFVILG